MGRDPENSKIANSQIFAKIIFFCEKVHIFTKVCRSLRKSADFCEYLQTFCENLPIFAKIYRCLRKFTFFCANVPILSNLQIFFAKNCRFLRKFTGFGNLQILAKICENLHFLLLRSADFCENLQILDFLH